ncbi:MAG: hypothetical protein WC044_11060 [Crocinitomicaceae bacterium]
MAFLVNVYMINELYSQEFADENHRGEESADNKLYEWEDEMNLRVEILEVDEERNAEYVLRGEKGDGQPFEITIPNMLLFNFIAEDNSVMQIACSESLLTDYELIINDKILTIYLKGEPYANPIPGVYIASKEFPKELITLDRD